MDKILVTVYVSPKDFTYFLSVLKVLDGLDIENNFRITKSDITWSMVFNSNFSVLQIPYDLYMKFYYCYNKS